MSVPADALKKSILESLDHIRTLRFHGWAAEAVHRDISLSQLHILLTLEERGPMPMTSLANLLSISGPSASSFVERLEERQWVARSRELEDRRVVTVEITAAGLEVTEEVLGSKREHFTALLDIMTPTELTNFLGGLQALESAIARLNPRPNAVAV